MRRLALLGVLVLLPGSADARPLKGSGPSALAVGYGAAWVGFGDGTVTRIDAKTLRPLSRRLANEVGGYITSLATGFGSVWAAPNSTPLQRLDPKTGAVQARIRNQPGRWSGAGTTVATGAGSVWVADYQRNAIFRVNPRTNRISRRKALPHRLRSITAGAVGVWVQTIPGRRPAAGPGGPRIVSRVDPPTLRLRRALRLSSCDGGIAPAARSLWLLDNCDGSLRRFNTRTRTLSAPVETSPGAWLVTAGFGSVWVSNGTTVWRIDGGGVVARIPARGGFVAAGEGFVWVLESSGGTVGWLRRIDPANNRLAGRPIRLASR